MSVSFIALSSAAIAQDSGSMPWTGAYLGVNVGSSMASTQLIIDDLINWDGAGAQGFSAGGFAGFNYQFNESWVGGLEVGGAFSSIEGHTEVDLGGFEFNSRTYTDWNAGVSARMGYLFSPTTLAYASVGARLFHGAGEMWDPNFPGDRLTEDDDFVGLIDIGVGIETAIASNVRFRGEYRADLLQTNDYGGLTVTPFVGTASASLIYAFGDGTMQSRPTSATGMDWTGFYAGILGGQDVAVAALNFGDGADTIDHNGIGSSGWSAGAVAGYNYQLNDQLVAGLEAGADFSTLASQQTFGPDGSEIGFRGENPWSVNARARLGYLASPDTLIYGFAGASFNHSTLSLVVDGDVIDDSETYDRVGFDLGGGIETALSSNVSLRAEYAYTILETTDLFDGISELGTMEQRKQKASIGVMFHLD